jgi:hypothetical protein
MDDLHDYKANPYTEGFSNGKIKKAGEIIEAQVAERIALIYAQLQFYQAFIAYAR